MTNNKQQTAVEWLFAELKNHLDMPSHHANEIIEQAKEMEKERMIKFCIDWFISREMNIKEYYEQTYGEGEQ
jgi:hypothetical protein